MKATIITFHCTPNYGATLQSVAMFKLFSQYFDNVELLDYRPKKITKNYNYIYWKRLRGFVASLLNVPTNLIKNRRFSKYLKQEANLSPKTFYNANDISIKTDCVVLESIGDNRFLSPTHRTSETILFNANIKQNKGNFEQSINELSNNHYKKENTSLAVKFMVRVSNKMQRVLKK